jgi:glycogen debranching enzyme
LYDDIAKLFEGLHAAMAFCRDQRLPELYCGVGRRAGPLVRYPVACSPQAWASAAPILLVQAVLGIVADAPARRLIVRNPRLPKPLRRLDVRGMRIRSALVDISFRRVGGHCHVDRLEVKGGPLKTQIEVD